MECAAFAWFTTYSNLTFMGFYDMFYYGQSYTGTFGFVRQVFLGDSVELIKDVFLLRLGNTKAMVPNLDDCSIFRYPGFYLDHLFVTAVFNGIIHQVYDSVKETIATTSGRAIPDVEVLVVDDDNNEVPRGEPAPAG